MTILQSTSLGKLAVEISTIHCENKLDDLKNILEAYND